jgi:glycosyltransferase involved in cell wall biosynthesis
MLQFKKQGHKVLSLSQLPGIDINPFLISKGIEAYSFVLQGKPSFFYYVRHLLFFIRFCYKHKVNVVFSHLDQANFVTAIGQYFIPATAYLSRHHIDEAALYKYHLSISYRLTNILAKKIIVVSKRSLNYAIAEEKVSPSKLMHINLAYDFTLYNSPNLDNVSNLRKEYGDKLLLLTVGRLTQFKRPELSIKVLQDLRGRGIDARLIILGDGEMRDELNLHITQSKLTDYVYIKGHVNNVLDFLAASDFLIHPSVLESSCVVIKEAGLIKKSVIVCQGIGDFDEYIQTGHNGFFVNKDRFVEESVAIIESHFNNKVLLSTMGSNLSKDIVRLFDINNVIEKYIPLVESKFLK